jgi:modification methylase
MLSTTANVHIGNSNNLDFIEDECIALVVTSPPYPMIAMWDGLFSENNPEIGRYLASEDGSTAFALMHEELNKVWKEIERVLIPGGIACINIGDAVRKTNSFRLYPNHAQIIQVFTHLGFDVLPGIIWRKQTNAPNKFMGSGMLPAGAYITLEHEYILVFRKGEKRVFSSVQEKAVRQKSAFFWEERNSWFSDVWDFKGVRQTLGIPKTRTRRGAYPFELAYRLINMYTVYGDIVLDPFLGTGTTLHAAMAACRNSIGVELDRQFLEMVRPEPANLLRLSNDRIEERIRNHIAFIDDYSSKRTIKHNNTFFDFPVVTSQEKRLEIHFLKDIEIQKDNRYHTIYSEQALFSFPTADINFLRHD